MKKHLFTLAFLALLLYGCGPVYVVHQDPPPQQAPPPSDPEVSYQSFYDQLSPYGQWIDNPSYGYVWMPDAGPDFKPYASNGHWVYTDEGWTWASNYSWGWATFHYGRWFFQDGYGWMWVPGHEWAPAWVSWRNSPDYYGWAPLGPNVSINVSFGGGYNPPPHYWSFVPHQYVASPQVNNYYVNENRNTTIINTTTIINNTTIVNNNIHNNNTTVINNRNRVYAGGPDPEEAGRFGGGPVRQVALRESNTPGEQMNNGGLSLYRPRINPATAPNANGPGAGGSRSTVAPPRLQTLNNARPVNPMRYSNNGNQPPAGGGRTDITPFASRPAVTPATGNEQPAVNNANTNNPSANNNGGSNYPREREGFRPVINPPAGNNNPNNPANPASGTNPRTTGFPTRNSNPSGGNPPSGGQPRQTFQPGQRGTPPVQSTIPGQTMTAGQHGSQPGGPPVRTNTVKPLVKPAPPAHPDDDKTKNKDKKKDIKED